MLPKSHIFAGVVFSVILLSFFNMDLLNVCIFFFSSVLIDVDHYLYYVFREKKFSLKKAYNKYLDLDKKFFSFKKKKQEKYHYSLCLLHGLEPIALVLFFGYFLNINFLIMVSFGFIFHLFFDIIQNIYEDKNPFVLLSLFYNIYHNRSKEDLWNHV